MLNMLLELSIPCFYGTELHCNSQLFQFNLYDSNWIEMDKPSRRDVLILMSFFQNPMSVKIGGLLNLNLETITTVTCFILIPMIDQKNQVITEKVEC